MIPLVHPRHQEIIYQAKFEELNRQKLIYKKKLKRLPLDTLLQEIFVKKLDQLIDFFFRLNQVEDRYRTDCVINLNILCRLLGDKEDAEDMLFASVITYTFVDEIHNTSLSFNNLFTGIILCNVDLRVLRKLACDEEKQNEHSDYVNSEFHLAKQAFVKHVRECSIRDGNFSKENLLKQALNYNFNAVVLERLTRDLGEGVKKVSQTCSYLFYISIAISDFQNPPRFKENSIWHAFTIEQYSSGEKQQATEDNCSYHIYQSWVDQATVLSDMQERKKAGTWVLTHEYMLQIFLPTLGRILGYKEPETSSIADLCKSIFGYIPKFKFPKSAWLTDSSNTIGGYSLKYSAHVINPREASLRLASILSKDMGIF